MTDLNRAQRFEAAADHIEKYGHLKNRYHQDSSDVRGPSCAMGALAWARGSTLYATDGEDYIGVMEDGVALSWYLPRRMQVPNWNDAEERTAEEVVETLRYAAKMEWEKMGEGQ